MTQSNNEPAGAAGNDTLKQRAAGLQGPSGAATNASASVPTKSAAAAPASPDASKRTAPAAGSQSDKSRAEAWDAGGSRSPGSLPAQISESCDSKGKSADGKASAPAGAPASGAKPAAVPTPTMAQGIRQTKGDDNRSVQAVAPSVTPSVAAPKSAGKLELTSPTDPKPSFKSDPVQPKRPSTVAPVIAARASPAASTSSGDSAAS